MKKLPLFSVFALCLAVWVVGWVNYFRQKQISQYKGTETQSHRILFSWQKN